MRLFEDKKECNGCTACLAVCPKNAISMKADDEGFLYPFIDEKLCISCKRCLSVCSQKLEESESIHSYKAFAVKNKSEQVRKTSTSGGAFTAISDYILENGGVVYGAKFDSDFNVVHAKATTKAERDVFKGSKYIQSDLNTVFTQVAADLKKSMPVVFVGTPCQSSGLRRFLDKERISTDTLLICDFLCHAVPSPLIWKEHLKSMQEQYKSKIISYECRSQVRGWRGHLEKAEFENGRIEYKSKLSQNFKDLFQGHYILRPSCTECKYLGDLHCSDITIGDFWGIEKQMPDFNDNIGVSLLLVNTEKGETFIKYISDKADMREIDVARALSGNHKNHVKHSANRDDFWNIYRKSGYISAVKKYAGYSAVGKIKWHAKNTVRKLIKVFSGNPD